MRCDWSSPINRSKPPWVVRSGGDGSGSRASPGTGGAGLRGGGGGGVATAASCCGTIGKGKFSHPPSRSKRLDAARTAKPLLAGFVGFAIGAVRYLPKLRHIATNTVNAELIGRGIRYRGRSDNGLFHVPRRAVLWQVPANKGAKVTATPAKIIEKAEILDLDALKRAPLASDPFPYVIVPGFLRGPARTAVARDYPAIKEPGSFPLGDLIYGSAFRDLVAELEGPALRAAFAEKFSIDLTGRPTMITVRGHARAADGRIHSDASTKLITVLIYMNESWEAEGGRLRLLRTPDSLDAAVAEVPPAAGTLLAFRVTPHSWHGHAPVSGPRRVIQLNWVTSPAVVRRERLRHGLSARMKRLFSFAR